MEQKKCIVWDWNGTLLDDVDLCIDSINYLLHKHHLNTLDSKESYQRIFQFPIIEYYKKAGFDFEKTPFDELAIDYMSYYQKRSLSCPLHNHVHAVLKHFDNKGYEQYLLSASKLDFLHEQLNGYDIKNYFKEILGLQDFYAHSKKELAFHFIQNQQHPRKDFVFIGDSVHDNQVARYAGCDSILIANGHEHIEKLLQTKSSVVASISDVLNLLP